LQQQPKASKQERNDTTGDEKSPATQNLLSPRKNIKKKKKIRSHSKLSMPDPTAEVPSCLSQVAAVCLLKE
jgi:hypothetical protein